MDKDAMIKDIMEKIDSLPPEEQEELCEIILDALEEMRKNKGEVNG